MAEPFKNRINPEVVAHLARTLDAAMGAQGVPFRADVFQEHALAGLTDLELKARVNQVAAALDAALPSAGRDIRAIGRALEAASGPAIPTAEGVTDGFSAWPLITWVERHATDTPEAALDILEALTDRFSSEFAVRPYLIAHPELAWAAVSRWADHDNLHVRRLASEGPRPRLPWGVQLKDSIEDPSRGLAILDRLVDDPELYVRRSVANHLGDVAKDHPDRAAAHAGRWLAEREDRLWVVKHGLRHLIKQGHPGALEVLGFGPPKLRVDGPLTVSPRIQLGDGLSIALTLVSTADTPQKLVIDLGIHFVKKRGDRRPKVFKWSTRTLKAGERVSLSRVLTLKPVSTRRHYPGVQGIDVRINGEIVADSEFFLDCEPGA